jgi:hypothetical protein
LIPQLWFAPPADPLSIDLLTDVVLPIAVHEVVSWEDIKPTRLDAMAAAGVVLENAADMARAFPELWPSHDAARQEKARSVTFGYGSSWVSVWWLRDQATRAPTSAARSCLPRLRAL